jgi:glycosyltransferase involved in cell wall biosynthesis
MIPLRQRLSEMAWIARARWRRKWRAILEGAALYPTRADGKRPFCVVSCEHNAGQAAVPCLESVHAQRYDRSLIRHVFIDDASTDDTDARVRNWLAGHPDHRVEYLHHVERRGGTANTLLGLRMAVPGEIVVELNGDDWLADAGVFNYLNKVYADPDVWMTYNTLRYLNGMPALWARPVPEEIITGNAYRDMDEWVSSAPHTFRSELFGHVLEGTLIDPETGEYWESADDQALYLAMLELAGRHARHLDRVMYVYNFREDSHCFAGSTLSQGRALRIRRQSRYLPLERL